jgi:hypothetical protein
MQVAGSDWQLKQDGQPATPEEPRFSTWEEALNNKQRNSGGPNGSGSGSGGRTGTNGATSGSGGGSGSGRQQAEQSSQQNGVLEDTFYR